MLTWNNREKHIAGIKVSNTYVPHIPFPRNPKMPTHSVQVFWVADTLAKNVTWKDSADSEGKPAFVAKYTATNKHTGKAGFLYVIRCVTLRVKPLEPPKLLPPPNTWHDEPPLGD